MSTNQSKPSVKPSVKPGIVSAQVAKAASGKPVLQAVASKPTATQAKAAALAPAVKSTPAKVAAPVVEKQVKEKVVKTPENPCGCGCGELVKKNFRMGHDARFHGWVKRVLDGRLDIKLIGTDKVPNSTVQSRKNVEIAVKSH